MSAISNNNDIFQQLVLNTEGLQALIEKSIFDGNEAETDRLSKLFEEQLEKVFSYAVQSREDLQLKLKLSKTILMVDHSLPSLVERAFDSLLKDIETNIPG